MRKKSKIILYFIAIFLLLQGGSIQAETRKETEKQPFYQPLNIKLNLEDFRPEVFFDKIRGFLTIPLLKKSKEGELKPPKVNLPTQEFEKELKDITGFNVSEVFKALGINFEGSWKLFVKTFIPLADSLLKLMKNLVLWATQQ